MPEILHHPGYWLYHFVVELTSQWNVFLYLSLNMANSQQSGLKPTHHRKQLEIHVFLRGFQARKANDFMAKDGNARGNEVQKALALETRPLGNQGPLMRVRLTCKSPCAGMVFWS